MPIVEKHLRLSATRAAQLERLEKSRALSEDEIIAEALDILLNLTELPDRSEYRG